MSGEFGGVANRLRDLAPVARDALDSPYEISDQMFAALRHVLHDVSSMTTVVSVPAQPRP